MRQFWRGAAPGRPSADVLTLPKVRGDLCLPNHAECLRQGQTRIAHRADRVHVARNRDFARASASNWHALDGQRGGGGLNYVETDSSEPDEDVHSLPAQNFQCRNAAVLIVAGTSIQFDAKRIRRYVCDLPRLLERAKRFKNGSA